MKTRKLSLFVFLVICVRQHALLQRSELDIALDSPVLMKILQSVDATTSDEHLFEVTLKLLKSICICMHETLKVKEDKLSVSEPNLIDDKNELTYTNWKEVELYKKIYNNTCFDLREELIKKLNNSHNMIENDEDIFLKANCAKNLELTTENIILTSTNSHPILQDDIKQHLEDILYRTLIETEKFHKYGIKRYSLFNKSIPYVNDNSKHSVIVILTLIPDKNIQKNKEPFAYSVPITQSEINETLHTNSHVDIHILDTKFDPRRKGSEEHIDSETIPECQRRSVYAFLVQSEHNNSTKVFKLLRKDNTIKIYMEVIVDSNHKDYCKICCQNETKNPFCIKDHIRDKKNTVKEINSLKNYKKTVSRIKSLVKMYGKRMKEQKKINVIMRQEKDSSECIGSCLDVTKFTGKEHRMKVPTKLPIPEQALVFNIHFKGPKLSTTTTSIINEGEKILATQNNHVTNYEESSKENIIQSKPETMKHSEQNKYSVEDAVSKIDNFQTILSETSFFNPYNKDVTTQQQLSNKYSEEKNSEFAENFRLGDINDDTKIYNDKEITTKIFTNSVYNYETAAMKYNEIFDDKIFDQTSEINIGNITSTPLVEQSDIPAVKYDEFHSMILTTPTMLGDPIDKDETNELLKGSSLRTVTESSILQSPMALHSFYVKERTNYESSQIMDLNKLRASTEITAINKHDDEFYDKNMHVLRQSNFLSKAKNQNFIPHYTETSINQPTIIEPETFSPISNQEKTNSKVQNYNYDRYIVTINSTRGINKLEDSFNKENNVKNRKDSKDEQETMTAMDYFKSKTNKEERTSETVFFNNHIKTNSKDMFTSIRPLFSEEVNLKKNITHTEKSNNKQISFQELTKKMFTPYASFQTLKMLSTATDFKSYDNLMTYYDEPHTERMKKFNLLVDSHSMLNTDKINVEQTESAPAIVWTTQDKAVHLNKKTKISDTAVTDLQNKDIKADEAFHKNKGNTETQNGVVLKTSKWSSIMANSEASISNYLSSSKTETISLSKRPQLQKYLKTKDYTIINKERTSCESINQYDKKTIEDIFSSTVSNLFLKPNSVDNMLPSTKIDDEEHNFVIPTSDLIIVKNTSEEKAHTINKTTQYDNQPSFKNIGISMKSAEKTGNRNDLMNENISENLPLSAQVFNKKTTLVESETSEELKKITTVVTASHAFSSEFHKRDAQTGIQNNYSNSNIEILNPSAEINSLLDPRLHKYDSLSAPRNGKEALITTKSSTSKSTSKNQKYNVQAKDHDSSKFSSVHSTIQSTISFEESKTKKGILNKDDNIPVMQDGSTIKSHMGKSSSDPSLRPKILLKPQTILADLDMHVIKKYTIELTSFDKEMSTLKWTSDTELHMNNELKAENNFTKTERNNKETIIVLPLSKSTRETTVEDNSYSSIENITLPKAEEASILTDRLKIEENYLNTKTSSISLSTQKSDDIPERVTEHYFDRTLVILKNNDQNQNDSLHFSMINNTLPSTKKMYETTSSRSPEIHYLTESIAPNNILVNTKTEKLTLKRTPDMGLHKNTNIFESNIINMTSKAENVISETPSNNKERLYQPIEEPITKSRVNENYISNTEKRPLMKTSTLNENFEECSNENTLTFSTSTLKTDDKRKTVKVDTDDLTLVTSKKNYQNHNKNLNFSVINNILPNTESIFKWFSYKSPDKYSVEEIAANNVIVDTIKRHEMETKTLKWTPEIGVNKNKDKSTTTKSNALTKGLNLLESSLTENYSSETERNNKVTVSNSIMETKFDSEINDEYLLNIRKWKLPITSKLMDDFKTEDKLNTKTSTSSTFTHNTDNISKADTEAIFDSISFISKANKQYHNENINFNTTNRSFSNLEKIYESNINRSPEKHNWSESIASKNIQEKYTLKWTSDIEHYKNKDIFKAKTVSVPSMTESYLYKDSKSKKYIPEIEGTNKFTESKPIRKTTSESRFDDNYHSRIGNKALLNPSTLTESFVTEENLKNFLFSTSTFKTNEITKSNTENILDSTLLISKVHDPNHNRSLDLSITSTISSKIGKIFESTSDRNTAILDPTEYISSTKMLNNNTIRSESKVKSNRAESNQDISFSNSRMEKDILNNVNFSIPTTISGINKIEQEIKIENRNHTEDSLRQNMSTFKINPQVVNKVNDNEIDLETYNTLSLKELKGLKKYIGVVKQIQLPTSWNQDAHKDIFKPVKAPYRYSDLNTNSRNNTSINYQSKFYNSKVTTTAESFYTDQNLINHYQDTTNISIIHNYDQHNLITPVTSDHFTNTKTGNLGKILDGKEESSKIIQKRVTLKTSDVSSFFPLSGNTEKPFETKTILSSVILPEVIENKIKTSSKKENSPSLLSTSNTIYNQNQIYTEEYKAASEHETTQSLFNTFPTDMFYKHLDYVEEIYPYEEFHGKLLDAKIHNSYDRKILTRLDKSPKILETTSQMYNSKKVTSNKSFESIYDGIMTMPSALVFDNLVTKYTTTVDALPKKHISKENFESTNYVTTNKPISKDIYLDQLSSSTDDNYVTEYTTTINVPIIDFVKYSASKLNYSTFKISTIFHKVENNSINTQISEKREISPDVNSTTSKPDQNALNSMKPILFKKKYKAANGNLMDNQYPDLLKDLNQNTVKIFVTNNLSSITEGYTNRNNSSRKDTTSNIYVKTTAHVLKNTNNIFQYENISKEVLRNVKKPYRSNKTTEELRKVDVVNDISLDYDDTNNLTKYNNNYYSEKQKIDQSSSNDKVENKTIKGNMSSRGTTARIFMNNPRSKLITNLFKIFSQPISTNSPIFVVPFKANAHFENVNKFLESGTGKNILLLQNNMPVTEKMSQTSNNYITEIINKLKQKQREELSVDKMSQVSSPITVVKNSNHYEITSDDFDHVDVDKLQNNSKNNETADTQYYNQKMIKHENQTASISSTTELNAGDSTKIKKDKKIVTDDKAILRSQYLENYIMPSIFVFKNGILSKKYNLKSGAQTALNTRISEDTTEIIHVPQQPKDNMVAGTEKGIKANSVNKIYTTETRQESKNNYNNFETYSSETERNINTPTENPKTTYLYEKSFRSNTSNDSLSVNTKAMPNSIETVFFDLRSMAPFLTETTEILEESPKSFNLQEVDNGKSPTRFNQTYIRDKSLKISAEASVINHNELHFNEKYTTDIALRKTDFLSSENRAKLSTKTTERLEASPKLFNLQTVESENLFKQKYASDKPFENSVDAIQITENLLSFNDKSIKDIARRNNEIFKAINTTPIKRSHVADVSPVNRSNIDEVTNKFESAVSNSEFTKNLPHVEPQIPKEKRSTILPRRSHTIYNKNEKPLHRDLLDDALPNYLEVKGSSIKSDPENMATFLTETPKLLEKTPTPFDVKSKTSSIISKNTDKPMETSVNAITAQNHFINKSITDKKQERKSNTQDISKTLFENIHPPYLVHSSPVNDDVYKNISYDFESIPMNTESNKNISYTELSSSESKYTIMPVRDHKIYDLYKPSLRRDLLNDHLPIIPEEQMSNTKIELSSKENVAKFSTKTTETLQKSFNLEALNSGNLAKLERTYFNDKVSENSGSASHVSLNQFNQSMIAHAQRNNDEVAKVTPVKNIGTVLNITPVTKYDKVGKNNSFTAEYTQSNTISINKATSITLEGKKQVISVTTELCPTSKKKRRNYKNSSDVLNVESQNGTIVETTIVEENKLLQDSTIQPSFMTENTLGNKIKISTEYTQTLKETETENDLRNPNDDPISISKEIKNNELLQYLRILETPKDILQHDLITTKEISLREKDDATPLLQDSTIQPSFMTKNTQRNKMKMSTEYTQTLQETETENDLRNHNDDPISISKELKNNELLQYLRILETPKDILQHDLITTKEIGIREKDDATTVSMEIRRVPNEVLKNTFSLVSVNNQTFKIITFPQKPLLANETYNETVLNSYDFINMPNIYQQNETKTSQESSQTSQKNQTENEVRFLNDDSKSLSGEIRKSEALKYLNSLQKPKYIQQNETIINEKLSFNVSNNVTKLFKVYNNASGVSSEELKYNVVQSPLVRAKFHQNEMDSGPKSSKIYNENRAENGTLSNIVDPIPTEIRNNSSRIINKDTKILKEYNDKTRMLIEELENNVSELKVKINNQISEKITFTDQPLVANKPYFEGKSNKSNNVVSKQENFTITTENYFLTGLGSSDFAPKIAGATTIIQNITEILQDANKSTKNVSQSEYLSSRVNKTISTTSNFAEESDQGSTAGNFLEYTTQTYIKMSNNNSDEETIMQKTNRTQNYTENINATVTVPTLLIDGTATAHFKEKTNHSPAQTKLKEKNTPSKEHSYLNEKINLKNKRNKISKTSKDKKIYKTKAPTVNKQKHNIVYNTYEPTLEEDLDLEITTIRLAVKNSKSHASTKSKIRKNITKELAATKKKKEDKIATRLKHNKEANKFITSKGLTTTQSSAKIGTQSSSTLFQEIYTTTKSAHPRETYKHSAKIYSTSDMNNINIRSNVTYYQPHFYSTVIPTHTWKRVTPLIEMKKYLFTNIIKHNLEKISRNEAYKKHYIYTTSTKKTGDNNMYTELVTVRNVNFSVNKQTKTKKFQNISKISNKTYKQKEEVHNSITTKLQMTTQNDADLRIESFSDSLNPPNRSYGESVKINSEYAKLNVHNTTEYQKSLYSTVISSHKWNRVTPLIELKTDFFTNIIKQNLEKTSQNNTSTNVKAVKYIESTTKTSSILFTNKQSKNKESYRHDKKVIVTEQRNIAKEPQNRKTGKETIRRIKLTTRVMPMNGKKSKIKDKLKIKSFNKNNSQSENNRENQTNISLTVTKLVEKLFKGFYNAKVKDINGETYKYPSVTDSLKHTLHKTTKPNHWTRAPVHKLSKKLRSTIIPENRHGDVSNWNNQWNKIPKNIHINKPNHFTTESEIIQQLLDGFYKSGQNHEDPRKFKSKHKTTDAYDSQVMFRNWNRDYTRATPLALGTRNLMNDMQNIRNKINHIMEPYKSAAVDVMKYNPATRIVEIKSRNKNTDFNPYENSITAPTPSEDVEVNINELNKVKKLIVPPPVIYHNFANRHRKQRIEPQASLDYEVSFKNNFKTDVTVTRSTYKTFKSKVGNEDKKKDALSGMENINYGVPIFENLFIHSTTTHSKVKKYDKNMAGKLSLPPHNYYDKQYVGVVKNSAILKNYTKTDTPQSKFIFKNADFITRKVALSKTFPDNDQLLDPFDKNYYSINVGPNTNKWNMPLRKKISVNNNPKQFLTMNTNDFFSQRRLVTQRSSLPKERNILEPMPVLLNHMLGPVSNQKVLRPKFDGIENQMPISKPVPYFINPINYRQTDDFKIPHNAVGLSWKDRSKLLHENLQRDEEMMLSAEHPFIENVLDKPIYEPMEQNLRRSKTQNFKMKTAIRPTLRSQDPKKYFLAAPENVSKEASLVESALLFDRRKLEQTTVTEWWVDDMYMKVRLPLPINFNPGMVFPRRHFAKMEEVADLGALFIDDLVDYKEMLDRGELPLERATSREKGQPLCMEQFYRLLGVCRVAEAGRDRLELPRFGADGEREELVVVACRNYFYPIPVKASDRGRLTAGEIQAQLLHAMVDAAGAPPAPRVGLLTSMQRDQWASTREQLIKDENNRTNLELISRALCILCLDEAGGDRADAGADTSAMLRAMHGAGTRYHSANRWFDKTVQLIISSDGTLGMCYEHSAAEGVAVVRLAERALARAEVSDRPAPPPALLPAPQAMKWNLTPNVMRTIEQAARDLDREIADLDFKVYTYEGYGREFMKSCRTSPDVYIQLALQYAYYKMYGCLVSTYESASLRRFRSGRVDNIRSAHGAARAWAAAMCSAEPPPLNDTSGSDEGQKKVSFNLYGEQKKLELFDEAARKQTEIMEANILGRGIDNHLLGLREAARETLGELPALFTDDTYKQMIEFKLSTSQVTTTTDGTFMGYGAVVPDGYGCSYNPKKDHIIFCIASFVASSVTNTEAFRLSLEEALDSMKLMFQHRNVEK